MKILLESKYTLRPIENCNQRIFQLHFAKILIGASNFADQSKIKQYRAVNCAVSFVCV